MFQKIVLLRHHKLFHRSIFTQISSFPPHLSKDQAIPLDKFSSNVEKIIQTTNLPNNRSIAVSVSGGSDSLALSLLTHQWALQHEYKIYICIVDHKMRPESSEEALFVKQLLQHYFSVQQEFGVQQIQIQELLPSFYKNESDMRQDRLQTLIHFCREHHIPILFTGHHMDDQIETFITRFAFSSGLQGITGIPFVLQLYTTTPDFFLAKPLLNFSKPQLQSTCMVHNLKWIEDPSNLIPFTHRNRIRQLLPQWEQASISKPELLSLLSHFQTINSLLIDQVDYFFSHFISLYTTYGFAIIQKTAFLSLPKEISSKVIANLVATLRNKELQFESTYHSLVESLQKDQHVAKGRLSFTVQKHTILVTQEATNKKMTKQMIQVGQSILWDQCYQISVTLVSNRNTQPQWNAFLIRRITAAELSQVLLLLPYATRVKYSKNATLKKAVLSMPCVVDGKEVIHVPMINYTKYKELQVDIAFVAMHKQLPMKEAVYLKQE